MYLCPENFKIKKMAKTDQQIRGKVGNTIFYRVDGETRVRSAAADFRDANSDDQRSLRSRLRVATFFYQRLVGVISREIWKQAANGTGKNGFNLFMKVNMLVFNADGKIGDFSRLSLTAGALQEVNHLEAVVDDEDRVTLTWDGDAGLPSAGASDRLGVLVLYGNHSFSPVIVDGIEATRADRVAAFRLKRQPGITAHVYCFFSGQDGKTCSPTQYLRL